MTLKLNEGMLMTHDSPGIPFAHSIDESSSKVSNRDTTFVIIKKATPKKIICSTVHAQTSRLLLTLDQLVPKRINNSADGLSMSFLHNIATRGNNRATRIINHVPSSDSASTVRTRRSKRPKYSKRQIRV